MLVQIKSDISCESSAGQCWRGLWPAVFAAVIGGR